MKKILRASVICALICMSGCKKQQTAALTVTVFEAGKADAILIQSEAGSVLIDAGLEENSAQLLDELSDRGVDELNALIITHFDKDHVGGADWIINTLKTEHVYTSYLTKSSDDITSFEQALENAGLFAAVIKDTQTFSLGEAVFEISGAEGNYDKDESNNSSLIVKLSCAGKTCLFMGDAENERIEEYLAESDADCDLLKVPYHGHYQKKLNDLLAASSPEIAVITNSETEPEEKDLNKTLALLAEYGPEVYQTADGTVSFVMTAEGFRISQSE